MKIENAVSTYDQLKAMHMPSMAEALEETRLNPNFDNMSAEEKISYIVQTEHDARMSRKINRLIKEANFILPSACIDQLEDVPGRKYDKGLVHQLSLCDYIEKGRNIIICGPAGAGKTYISCALGTAACRKFYSVRYERTPDFLLSLSSAASFNNKMDFIKSYNRYDLIILDEWLSRPMREDDMYPLLDFVDYRCGTEKNKPIIFCSMHIPKEWYDLLTNENSFTTATTESILDRITCNSYRIYITSKHSSRKYFNDMKNDMQSDAQDDAKSDERGDIKSKK